MTAVLIAGLIIVAALVAWVALQNTQSQRRTQSVESQMTELRRDLQTMATAQAQSAGQIASIGQSVTQRLDSVTKTLQDGVSQSAQISAQSQAAMANELKNSQQTLGEIQKQLGAVQLAGSQMSQTAETLQNILGGAKTRGSLGEVTLERLLEDCLPKNRFARQHRFSSGEIADAVISFVTNSCRSIRSFHWMHTAASRKKAKKHAARLPPPSRTTPTPFQKNTSCRKKQRCPLPSCLCQAKASTTNC